MKSLNRITFTLLIGILTFGQSCFAGQFQFEMGSGWIKGKSNAAPLGEVLSAMADRFGFTVFLDDGLSMAPVTMEIQDELNMEEAIQRIVHPHSYAMMFGNSCNEDDGPNILEVWVCRKGHKYSTNYLELKPSGSVDGSGQSGPNEDGIALNETTMISSNFTGLSTPDTIRNYEADSDGKGLGPGRNNKNKNFLRPDFYLGKSPFGTPILKYKDQNKGPDYRLNAQEMRTAYEDFQQKKSTENHRKITAVYDLAYEKSAGQKANYSSSRNQELKQSFIKYKSKQ